MQIQFSIEKDTKNTRKFAEVHEDSDPEAVGSLYVQKWALKQIAQEAAVPDATHLVVTIEAVAAPA